jgi:hypothetical protein
MSWLYIKVTQAIVSVLFIVSLESSAFADITIGDFPFLRNSSITDNSLRVPPTGRLGLRSFAFVTMVGGVNFEAVAELPADRTGEDVCPHYDAGAPDGARLKIEIGGEVLSTLIYDWQLKPIALYADSEYTSVVSLFGSQTNQSQYHINYHPAFEDTLIGLRLLQADALLIDPAQFSNLPKHNGAVIVGPGESEFSYPRSAVEEVEELLDRLKTSDRFQSWVISDVDKSATIIITEGKLTIDLEPYHYFWRSETGLEAEYNGLIQEIASGASQERFKEILMRLEELGKQIETTTPDVVEAEIATSQIGQNRDIIDRLNPPVAESLRTTARFAALFRLAKNVNSECWGTFLEVMSGVQPIPQIETPNIWPRTQ